MRTHGRTIAVAAFGAALVSSASGMGCMEGGLNQNQQAPGNQDNGVAVGFGDIAVDPSGRFVIYGVDTHLQVSDLASGARHKIEGIENPQRLSFGPAGSDSIYIVGDRDGVHALAAFDVSTRRIRWSRPVTVKSHVGGDGLSTLPWIEPTGDGRFLVLTDEKQVVVLAARDGRVKQSLDLEHPAMDVDVLPDSSRVLVTEWHTGGGATASTQIFSLGLGDGAVKRITVPNCSSELVLTPDASYAFLAPTICVKDPVSLIDLRTNKFVRNLPGFGPVAVAADGALAVAFIDATNIDRTLFDDPSKIPDPAAGRYHLMLIDTATLAFNTVPVGASLPRYAITPDGRVLLVDSPVWTGTTGRVRLLEVATRQLVELSGESDVRLENYVVTTDAEKVFLLYRGLYRIDLGSARLTSIQLPFLPLNINITADDGFLILRENQTRLWVYDIARGELSGSLDTTPVAMRIPVRERLTE